MGNQQASTPLQNQMQKIQKPKLQEQTKKAVKGLLASHISDESHDAGPNKIRSSSKYEIKPIKAPIVDIKIRNKTHQGVDIIPN